MWKFQIWLRFCLSEHTLVSFSMVEMIFLFAVPVAEYHRSLRNLLSGYLLRKFKSSNGWHKLWVIFTNSCLFFFKTFEDDFPLASLPLLGYSVRQPDPSDGINKDYVFKLVFKNHVYFFRAESQYTFERYV